MSRIGQKLAVMCSTAIVMGGVALFGSVAPAAAEEECVIECEKCTCNLKTGICECTNCKITGCEVKPGG